MTTAIQLEDNQLRQLAQEVAIRMRPRRLLNRNEVLAITHLSRTQLWRLMDAGQFPQPKKTTTAGRMWLAGDVDEWIGQLESDDIDVSGEKRAQLQAAAYSSTSKRRKQK